MTTLADINAKKSENRLEYFGEYKGVEWILNGERDGNKVWWYLTDDEGENPMPAENLQDAVEAMKENIDYNTSK
jgi:hypothetical protein